VIREIDLLGMFLDFLFHCFESAVAGHARNQQLTIALLCNGKITSGQLDRQLFIRAVG
jgi:hypothetical protein